MSIVIREMRHEDLEGVLAIERSSFPTPWSPRIFREELRLGGRIWRVAEAEEEVIGYGGVLLMGADGHLMNLAVRKDRRGAGLGKALLSQLIDEAVASGVIRMTLEVRPSNDPAIELYREAGFDVAGRRPGYYTDTREDAVIMWTRDLTSPEAEEFRDGLRRHRRNVLSRTDPRSVAHSDLGSDMRRGARPEKAVPAPGSQADPAPAPGSERDPVQTLLAVETSCDETAAAVIRGPRDLLSSVVASQVDFHRRFGGVVPEIASRKHTEAIVPVVDEALEEAGLTMRELDAIAVTQGPGLIGALAVGVAYAKGLAFALDIPLVGVNHLEGHIFANVLADPDVQPPLVALIISGGHTSLVHMPEWGVYRTLGQTLDDAAGEAFDKVAKLLDLGYPGGPVLSKLAAGGDPNAIPFPRPMLRSGDYDFSLSGLKTAVINYVRREQSASRSIDLPDLAASFQQAIVDVQVAKAVAAVSETGVKTFCLAGGVAANPALRDALREAMESIGVRVSIPPFSFCTDNAAMIAAAGYWRLLRGDVLELEAEAVASLKLETP